MKHNCSLMSKPEVVFPFSKEIGGKTYRQSLINPNYAGNCLKTNAQRIVDQLHREGWAARIVRYDTPIGYVYLVYERRTGKEMRKSKRMNK